MIEGEYRVPYLAHSPMEPMTASALVTDNSVEIWAGTQGPTNVLQMASKLTGLSEEKIKVNTTFLGGDLGAEPNSILLKPLLMQPCR